MFAAGNGGAESDSCNLDGYINNLYTIGIASVEKTGMPPFYSETCAAHLISAYGGFAITTTKDENCTGSFSGTSASAPIVAAVIALALEANPTLTWRDIKHLLVNFS